MSNERSRPTTPTPQQDADLAPSPRYDEKQVAELLRRAAQLERKQPVVASSLATRLIGGPWRRTIERVVDGELQTSDHENLLADLRAALPAEGQRQTHVASVGRALTLSGMSGPTRVELTITPRAGKTLLRLEVSAGMMAGAYYGGTLLTLSSVGAGMIAGAHQAHMGAAWIVLAGVSALGGAFALVRGLFGRQSQSKFLHFERVADALADRIADEVASRQPK